MNSNDSRTYFYITLNLLHSDKVDFDREQLQDIDWMAFVTFLKKNVILLRARKQLDKFQIQIPEEFNAIFNEERERIPDALRIMRKINELCLNENITCIFHKAFMHFPDMGHDIDILLPSFDIEKQLINALNLKKDSNSFTNLIASKCSYYIENSNTQIETHHCRMGHLGEHVLFPSEILKKYSQKEIEHYKYPVPNNEDLILIQVLQRIFSHRFIRVSDLLFSFKLLKETGIDWDTVLSTSEKIGVLKGLVFYISTVKSFGSKYGLDLNVSDVFNTGTLLSKTGFSKSFYFIPTKSIVTSYQCKVIRDIKKRDFQSLARFILIPFLFVITIIRNQLNKKNKR